MGRDHACSSTKGLVYELPDICGGCRSCSISVCGFGVVMVVCACAGVRVRACARLIVGGSVGGCVGWRWCGVGGRTHVGTV